MDSKEGEKVQLYVYDLSNGLARQLSPMLLNKQVLHTRCSHPAPRCSQTLHCHAIVCRSTASGIQLSLWVGWNTITEVG